MVYNASKYEGLHYAPFSINYRPRELIMNFIVFEDQFDQNRPKFIEIDSASKNYRPQAKYIEASRGDVPVRSSPNS